jgi:hypothetical protein
MVLQATRPCNEATMLALKSKLVWRSFTVMMMIIIIIVPHPNSMTVWTPQTLHWVMVLILVVAHAWLLMRGGGEGNFWWRRKSFFVLLHARPLAMDLMRVLVSIWPRFEYFYWLWNPLVSILSYVKTSSDFSSVLFREHVAELKNSRAIQKSKHLTRADISFSEMPHVKFFLVSGGNHMKKWKAKSKNSHYSW